MTVVTDGAELLARVQAPRVEEEPVEVEGAAGAPEEGAEDGAAEARTGDSSAGLERAEG